MIPRSPVSFVVVCSLLVGIACGEKKEPVAAPASKAGATVKETPKAADPAPETIRPAGPGHQDYKVGDDAGSIAGTVKLDGKPRARKPLPIEAEKYCKDYYKDEIPLDEKVIVGKDGTLANCFVYVKGGLEKFKFPAPAAAVTIDQLGCVYRPHVFGIMAGQKLKILNSDDVGHNIHSQPKINQEFNLQQPNKGGEAERDFALPEIPVFIKCDVHSWMGAYACVVSHPYYVVTGEDGKFEIKGLNPGDYEIEVWHEKYKTLSKKVTVKAKGAETADFTFKVE